MQLSVLSIDFTNAIRSLRCKNKVSEAGIRFDDSDGNAVLECGPLVYRIPAFGEWSASVAFSGRVLLALAKIPQVHGAWTRIDFTAGKLTIGSLSTPARISGGLAGSE